MMAALRALAGRLRRDRDPFELTWLDRAPLWWRLRKLRCHYLERREGLR